MIALDHLPPTNDRTGTSVLLRCSNTNSSTDSSARNISTNVIMYGKMPPLDLDA
jgi:hypothetical protein